MSAPSTNLILGGNGALGRELARQLINAREPVMIASRSGTTGIPGASSAMCDANDAKRVKQLVSGARACYVTIGVDFNRYGQLWPPLIQGLIDGLTDTGVPLIFADNLYMYGPCGEAMREDMGYTDYGIKPRTRSYVAGQLESAHREGRIQMAMVRASDFYGPGAGMNSLVDGFIISPALAGKTVRLIGSLNQPHTFTYLADYARAMISVAADESSWGESWHVPNAPPVTVGSLIGSVEELLRRRIRAQVMPGWLLAAAGLVSPLMRELKEMQFIWNTPYLVDHDKFARKFWSDFTPMDTGLQASVDWARKKQ